VGLVVVVSVVTMCSLVTQDTVVVPAGGYVVIRIVSNNPGFWHMHCHMSHHLFYGMGLVLNEVSRSP
jgi:FtsP/CotA-like multicopper oxidase with cupredoxin domain